MYLLRRSQNSPRCSVSEERPLACGPVTAGGRAGRRWPHGPSPRPASWPASPPTARKQAAHTAPQAFSLQAWVAIVTSDRSPARGSRASARRPSARGPPLRSRGARRHRACLGRADSVAVPAEGALCPFLQSQTTGVLCWKLIQVSRKHRPRSRPHALRGARHSALFRACLVSLCRDVQRGRHWRPGPCVRPLPHPIASARRPLRGCRVHGRARACTSVPCTSACAWR